MNYINHYEKLILRSLARGYKKPNPSRDGYSYYETHHIVPKCLGGSDEKSNLVLLTPEEHFIAHLLLTKIYPRNHSLVYAVNMMCVGEHRNNKMYGWIRKKISSTISNDTNRAQKISQSLKGRKISKKTIEKIVESRKNYRHSQDTKDKISKSNKGKVKTAEHCNKIREKLSGGKHSIEHHKKVIKTKILNGTLFPSHETKNKIANTLSTYKWYNNGKTNVRSNQCPAGFVCGRLKFTRKPKYFESEKKLDHISQLKIIKSESSHGNTGMKNNLWKGYYITPDGIFNSSIDAAKYYNVTDKTIRDRCKSKNPIFSQWLCINQLGLLE